MSESKIIASVRRPLGTETLTAEARAELDRMLARNRRRSASANLGPYSGYAIGLDLGAGNVGWSVLFLDDSSPVFLSDADIDALNRGLPKGAAKLQLPRSKWLPFVPIGTHKFETRRQVKSTEISIPKQRPLARAKRKMLNQRQARRAHLKQALVEAGLLPGPGQTLMGSVDVKSDELRVRLLDASFVAHPHDLGRALYNVFKRRGWMAPMGRGGADGDSKFGKSATQKYREALDEFGCSTVGVFLERCQADARSDGRPIRKRHRTLAKQQEAKTEERQRAFGQGARSYERLAFLSPTFELIEEEAEKLRDAQRAHVRIDDKDWANVLDKAEYRRPIQFGIPGPCRYLPDRSRTIVALPSFQRFRIVEAVENLRLPGGGRLSLAQRDQAIAALEAEPDKLSVGRLARTLGVRALKGEAAHDLPRFIPGDRTSGILRPILGQSWGALSLDAKDALVLRLLRRNAEEDEKGRPRAWTREDETRLADDLRAEFGVDLGQALLEVELDEDRFGGVSLATARGLTRGILDGLDHEGRIAALGAPPPTLDVYADLPYYGRVLPEICLPSESFAPNERTAEEERVSGRCANPDLHILLNRVRKVVSGIQAMMGGIAPTRITIEFARDALSPDEEGEYYKKAKKREKAREDALDEIRKVLKERTPRGPRGDLLIQRYMLAEAQAWRDYDGGEISRSALFDGAEYQIDHVVPAAFGQRQRDNLFVSRFNRLKGARTPWEAFGDDPSFAGALLAFALFGERQRLGGLKAAIADKKRKRGAAFIEGCRKGIERCEKAIVELESFAATRGFVVDSRVTAALANAKEQKKEVARARLLTALGPRGVEIEPDFAARDASNAAYGAKLAKKYLEAIGAECVAIKPWAVGALRGMFDLEKNRADLRNHAQDAFAIAHFDSRVLIPGFARINHAKNVWMGWEQAREARALAWALADIKGGTPLFENLIENVVRMKAILPCIATAHRRDTQWNPGDPLGGTFGAFGGENIYSKRRGDGGDKVGYRGLKKRADIKTVERLSEKKAPFSKKKGASDNGAYIDSTAKFAIFQEKGEIPRAVSATLNFTKLSGAEREALFADRVVIRAGDTIVWENEALVVRSFEADGRAGSFPIDVSSREREARRRFAVPAAEAEETLVREVADVLGRRLHARRAHRRGLEPVPYPVEQRSGDVPGGIRKRDDTPDG